MNVENELALARKVVSEGPGALADVDTIHRVGELLTFTLDEYQRLIALKESITRYLAISSPPRPLCLAVFGPPGSGKSRAVKEIAETIDKKLLAQSVDLNLTQVRSIDELAANVARAKEMARGKVPFVFFDEFDSNHQGTAWGWLSWFLAPMQDAVFRSHGESIELKQAIYVFAGGTAASFAEFGRSDERKFRLAKGPDFVSRLRGFIDVEGIDATELRAVRRAVLLRHHLTMQGKEVDDELRDAVLQNGRYKHGARSLEALVEMMNPKCKAALTLSELPPRHLLSIHADLGHLDRAAIGGCIGLSASVDDASTFKAVVLALTLDGATIASGAMGLVGGESLLKLLEGDLVQLPRRLELPLNATPRILAIKPKLSDPTRAKDVPPSPMVELLPTPEVEEHELMTWLAPADNVRWNDSLALFRMRHALASQCVARVAIGGRLDGFLGRFPSVAESLMIAIAMGQPVFVAGGFGGVAEWVGRLLGLGDGWIGIPPGFDCDPLAVADWAGREHHFRPPPHHTDLPLGRADLIDFFMRHALGGRNWSDNGLNARENRHLFQSTNPAEIAKLVRCGLHRRFS